MTEFELIDRFFRDCGARRNDVALGVGDDAALLDCPPGMQLVAAVDTLVAGVHFPHGSPAESVGHRALAVNLSDLASMGARPAWALLALTLPEVDEAWLQRFATGLSALARAHDVAVVGGDTTSGPLCISLQLLGHVPKDLALKRSGGRPGDLLFVSGMPGEAAAGLAIEQGRLAASAGDATRLRERFLFPKARVRLGERLRGIASACIDVSDGLLGDAAKLAAASGCGAELRLEDLPISEVLLRVAGEKQACELALTGGDDYELCFSVPATKVEAMRRALSVEECAHRCIGALRVTRGAVVTHHGTVMEFSHPGFDHFTEHADRR